MKNSLDTEKDSRLPAKNTFTDIGNSKKLLSASPACPACPASPAGSDKSGRYLSPRPEGRGNKLQI